MGGDEHALDDRALRAAGAQAEHVPVVVETEFAVGHEGEKHVRVGAAGAPVRHRNHHAQPVADIAARAIIPAAVEDETALNRLRHALRRERDRHAQVAGRAEQLDLSLLRQLRHPPGVSRVERNHPTGGGIAARQLCDRLGVRGQVEFITAEAARLEHPIDAGLHDAAVDFVAYAPFLFHRGRALAQPRRHRARPAEHLGGRQVRLRNRDRWTHAVLHLMSQRRPRRAAS